MLNEKETLEKEILLMLKDSSQPAGCGSLCTALQMKGFRISEATTGRILRELDHSGYTDKSGYQGRSLTVVGEARVQELLQTERRQQLGQELTQAVQGHTKEQLLEVLVARTAIEGALAELAARRANHDDIAVLSSILDRQLHGLQTDRMTADEDVAFHAELAKVAGNKTLAAAIGLIRQDHQLSPALEIIRRRVGSKFYIDHKRIVEAIENHDPVAAKSAMYRHIEGLMQDVEKYWRDESE